MTGKPRLLLSLAALLGAALCGSCLEIPDDRPNIVLILADDLGWSDLGCQGSAYYQTPAIDRLASEGMRFTDAYANAPNCAPTRASLMTGLYTPRHGIFTVGDPWRGPKPSRRLIPTPNRTALSRATETLPEFLEASGYRRAHVGKWHLGDAPSGGPVEHGFEINVGGSGQGHPPSHFSPYGLTALSDGSEGEYLTRRLTDEALDFIREHRNEPFFLYLSHYAVHTPIEAPAETAAAYERRPGWHGQSDATYAAMIEEVDRSVESLIALLEELDLRKRTVVFFLSDNGGLGGYESSGLPGSRRITDNWPLKGGKGQLYEGGIRIPWIVSWPGRIPSGTVCEDPVLTLDLAPTILDLAGVDTSAEEKFDGISLKPILLDGEGSPERPLFWFFPAYLEAYGRPGIRTSPAAAIRRGDFKLIWFFEADRLELYDLRSDIGETTNLAESQPEQLEALKAVLEDWIQSVHAPVPTPNPEFEGPPRQFPGDNVRDSEAATGVTGIG